MSVHPRRFRAGAVTVAVLAVVAAGAGGLGDTPQRAPDPRPVAEIAPIAAPELREFYTQELTWGSCVTFASTPEEKNALVDPAFECAYLRVPLDYEEPDGPVAQIGVIRRQATDPDERIGSLVTNPGGPGGSGIGFLPGIAQGIGNGEVAQRFDLIGFDPRGVGVSTPGIVCLTPAEQDALRAGEIGGNDPEAFNREFAATCAQRTGLDVLATVGTRDVARDMDVLRAALGDERLSYLGYSYGTRIGTVYAKEFPERVRALVLDGADDPSDNRTEGLVNQMAGFQQAFDAFAADCVQRGDCPLGTDPAQATDAYRALLQPLLDAPVPTADGRKLSFADAQTGTIAALYGPQGWEPLRRGLAELAAGEGTTLIQLADSYYGRTPDGGYDQSGDAFTAVQCVDEPRVTDPAEIAERDRKIAEAAPFLDSGIPSSVARDVCAFWPVPVTSEQVPTPAGLPPVLVVSTTGDPATPYQAGVDLAEELRGGLLTADGTQHTAAFKNSTCIDEAVSRYLVDLELPDEGTTCQLPGASA
jgi:pimeloyl-ACP methyl ester carboxylesterase